jgi:hypothetical protein
MAAGLAALGVMAAMVVSEKEREGQVAAAKGVLMDTDDVPSEEPSRPSCRRPWQCWRAPHHPGGAGTSS